MAQAIAEHRNLLRDEEAEKSTLGAMIVNIDVIDDVMAILGEDCSVFALDHHRRIFTAILTLYREGNPIDLVTIMAADSTIGATSLSEITDYYGKSSNATYYAEIVRDSWCKRRLMEIAARVPINIKKGVGFRELLTGIEQEVFALGEGRSRAGTVAIKGIAQGERVVIDSILDGKSRHGVATGLRQLDGILKPLQPGDYMLLAACPSVGKTTLACNIALNTARNQSNPVLFLSLEMSKEAVGRKMLSVCGGLDMDSIERGWITRSDVELKLAAACRDLCALPIYINDEAGVTPMEFRSIVRTAVSRHGIKLVVIDYLQLMRVPNAESITVEVSIISREIKAAAKEVGVPIIALSQLNRAGAEGRPRLNHLRQSGSLEQDADVVLLLSKDDEDGVILVDVAKQRVGPTGDAKIYFKKDTQQFRDLGWNQEPTPAPTRFPDTEGRFDEFGNTDGGGFGRTSSPIEEDYNEQDDLF